MNRKFCTALGLAILLSTASNAQAIELKKGVGSGWFLTVHSWWQQWPERPDAKNPPRLRENEDSRADIRRLKKAGFDHMRLHFHLDGLLFWKECKGWKGGEYTDESYGTKCYGRHWAKQKKAKWRTKQRFFIDNKVYLDRFIDAIKRITGEGMDFIVVPHGFNRAPGALGNFMHVALEEDAAFRKLHLKFWSHLARRIRKEIPNWRRVAFQTHNEPNFCADVKPQLSKWRSHEKQIIRTIRKQIPTSTILPTAVCTSGDFFFANDDQHPKVRVDQVMAPYKQFKNLIYTIHFRQPRVFVFQSFHNTVDVKRLKYPMSRGNVSSVLSKADESKSELEDYRDNQWRRAVIFNAIRQAADWKTKHGVRLHITEFGTTRSNVDGKGGGPDRRSRLLYTRDIIDAMKRYGITWTYSQWRDWDGITKKYVYENSEFNYKNRALDAQMVKRLMR